MHVAPAFPPVARQWHEEATLAAYSCGGSHGFEAPPTGFASHRVPFSPAATPRDDSGTVTRDDRSSAQSELSTRCALASASSRLHMARRQRRCRVSDPAGLTPLHHRRVGLRTALTIHGFSHRWRTIAREIDMPEAVSLATMEHAMGAGDHGALVPGCHGRACPDHPSNCLLRRSLMAGSSGQARG